MAIRIGLRSRPPLAAPEKGSLDFATARVGNPFGSRLISLSDLDERQAEQVAPTTGEALTAVQRLPPVRSAPSLGTPALLATSPAGAPELPRRENLRRLAARGMGAGPGGRLPQLPAIQQAFGRHDVGHVQAHLGEAAATSCRALGARAYASGEAIAFSESSPDLHTVAHEAAHVVQQRAGIDLPSGISSPGDRYERHAEEVADRVVQGRSAEPLLDSLAGRENSLSSGRAGRRGIPPIQMNGNGNPPTQEMNLTRAKRDEYLIEIRKGKNQRTINLKRAKFASQDAIEEEFPEQKSIEEEFPEQKFLWPWEKPGPGHKYTAEERDLKHQYVDRAIRDLLEEVETTPLLEEGLQEIQETYHLDECKLLDALTDKPRIRYSFNPAYEVLLDKSQKRIAVRMEGTDKSNKHRTNVEFTPATLRLLSSPNGQALETEVGASMVANPLSQDHQKGSEAQLDTEQDPMMKRLRKGKGNKNKYIKGHLLNDHLGGPARPYNLFPITQEANFKHLAWIEKFVKADVKAGFVVRYQVEVDPPPGQITANYVSSTPEGHEVKAVFKCEFARLDVNNSDIPQSKVTLKVESDYGQSQSSPHDVANEPAYKGRYQALNEGKKTPAVSAKSPYQNEARVDVQGYNQEEMNKSKRRDLIEQPVTSFSSPSPHSSKMKIDSDALPSGRLKLSDSNLSTTWQKVVPGWSAGDINAWINDLNQRNVKFWKEVENLAIKHNLPHRVATELFAGTKALGKEVMKLR